MSPTVILVLVFAQTSISARPPSAAEVNIARQNFYCSVALFKKTVRSNTECAIRLIYEKDRLCLSKSTKDTGIVSATCLEKKNMDALLKRSASFVNNSLQCIEELNCNAKSCPAIPAASVR